MRISVKLFFLLSAILPIFSFASDPSTFEGQWKGKGTYILNGEITQCSLMQLGFETSNGRFSFLAGKRICEKHEEDFYRVDMAYQDGILYYNGKKVGEFDGNFLKAAFRAQEPSGKFRNWRMSMHRQGKHLMYEESRTMDGESTPMISFAGLLILE